jgi:hypothetical protein
MLMSAPVRSGGTQAPCAVVAGNSAAWRRTAGESRRADEAWELADKLVERRQRGAATVQARDWTPHVMIRQFSVRVVRLTGDE